MPPKQKKGKKKADDEWTGTTVDDSIQTPEEAEQEIKPKPKLNAFESLADDQQEEDLNVSNLSLNKSSKKKQKKKQLQESNEQSPKEQQKSLYAEADEEPAAEKKQQGSFVSKTDNFTATGVLLSPERSKDIQIDKFSVAAYGTQLINDTSLSIMYGKRYGLVGANGSGKSTLLKVLAHRQVPIQDGVKLYLLEKEFEPTNLTAVQAVVEIVSSERDKLEEEMNELLSTVEGASSPRLDFIHERMQDLDVSFAEQKARNILHGLGFTQEMQDMTTKEFSGGWRMRVALARALFVKPTVLFLDDATNHLDLSAVVWLEEYLLSYPHTIVIVSHSSDFMNGICTDVMYLHNRKLDYFSGNYDTFIKVKSEMDEAAHKKHKADTKKMQKVKENLSKTGAAAKQAKSHQKMMLKQREKDGVVDLADFQQIRDVEIRFQNCGGGLPSPFLKFNDVSFGYPGRKQLFHDLNFGLDLSSRVALVGPNGIGKSTLMKLMGGELQPETGTVERHHHLKIARFHQHLTEQLNLQMSAVEWLCKQLTDIRPQQMRSILGSFGLQGQSQTCAMECLSDGQLRRVVFAWLAKKNCHLLMLDEPTNFLDLETIDALAEGIRQFDGGVILVSHDFRLINQVADEIWVVEDGTVTEQRCDIQEYKDSLRKKVAENQELQLTAK